MLIAVRVDRVTLDTSTNRFVVILKDDINARWLPIVVGSSEAQAIALQLEKISPPRPLTHDLIANIFAGLGVEVEKVVVNDLKEDTFYARLFIKQENELGRQFIEIDARPSDSIAIALQRGCPIFVSQSVWDRAEADPVDGRRHLGRDDGGGEGWRGRVGRVEVESLEDGGGAS